MNRLITGIIAGGLWLLVIYSHSHALLWAVVTLATCLALKEYYSICLADQESSLRVGGIITGLAPLFFAFSGDLGFVVAGLLLSLICQFLLIISRFSTIKNPFLLICKFCFGSTYIGLCAAHLLLIMGLPNGWFWLFLLSIIICSSDIGAYYVGSTLGKVKLCPSISPGKTVEGFFGGILFAVAAALIFTHFAGPDLDPIKVVFLALILSSLSVIGDLTESIFKRSNNVKDSGAILPGHGGILDRVDSLLLTSPVLFYILYLKYSGQF